MQKKDFENLAPKNIKYKEKENGTVIHGDISKKVTAVLRDFSSKRKKDNKDNNGLPTLEIQDKRKKRNKYDKIRYKSK